MPEQSNVGNPEQPLKVDVTLGSNPADVFIAAVIPSGTDQIQVFSDGHKNDAEYCAMLLVAATQLLAQIGETLQKEKSPIINPFARRRHFTVK